MKKSLLFAVCICFTVLSEGFTQNTITVFQGMTLWDGQAEEIITDAVMVIQGREILAIGKAEEVEIPVKATLIDCSGMYMIPGLINAHAHVGYDGAVDEAHYSAQNIINQLERYARFGITTVASLGEDRTQARAFRDVNDSTVHAARARLYIAGDIIQGKTSEDARQKVIENVEQGTDFIKIRVDRNRGRTAAMPSEIYASIIDEAHLQGKMLMAHIYDLDLAKDLVKHGADFIAHSVRDTKVDQEFISLLKSNKVCYCPTLTRDLSTYVYGRKASFFEDSYFRAEFEASEYQHLLREENQLRVREGIDYQNNQEALKMAMTNLKILANSNVQVAMGTDSGMPGRFQGYFEQLEMEMMQDAGMTPFNILKSATSGAADCLQLHRLGVLKSGNKADFLLLSQNPLSDIKNLRSIQSVWIGGAKVSTK